MLSNDTITMKPPYTLTSQILSLVVEISEKLGLVRGANLIKLPTELRKRNRIKTIQSSLEIEGNTLTVEQITALLENKRILAPEKDILEVQNAIQIYDQLDSMDVYSLDSLLQAHKTLMTGLVSNAGVFRSGAVGIVRGNQVTHIAPPGHMVYALMTDLFQYIQNDEDPGLIKSCVFHYEFEFIHPFTDGNGRMGRLWQTLLLKEYNPVFEFLPIETLIKKRQDAYYKSLGDSDNAGNSTIFIEFMLTIINDSLTDLLSTQNVIVDGSDRIVIFKSHIGSNKFKRADYLNYFKNISTATASRDLKNAVINDILVKTGDGRTTEYCYL